MIKIMVVLWPAILPTQPPVTQALIHPTSEAASTSLKQNLANARILPYLQDLITLPFYQARVYVWHDCHRINFYHCCFYPFQQLPVQLQFFQFAEVPVFNCFCQSSVTFQKKRQINTANSIST